MTITQMYKLAALATGLLFGTLLAPAALHAQSVSFAGVQTTVPASGLTSPTAVAVDAASDVFIADASGFVIKVPAGGGPQITVPTSNLNTPEGVAVDAAGNVFIADTQNSRVVEIVAASGAQITVATPGLSILGGVAVDAFGNLFIVDSGNGRVVEVPANGGAQITIPTSGLSFPGGVAVDAAGNVFIADAGNNRVVEVPKGAPQTTISSGLYGPNGVAVDGAGNVFIADGGNNRVVEVPAAGGAQITVGSGLSNPYGLAVDGGGNVVIADTGNDRVVEVQRTSVNFGRANICPAGRTTPAPCSQTLTLNYSVTATGLLGSVKLFTAGAPGSDFTLAGGGTCTGLVTAGTQCTVNVTFTPQAAGPRNGAIQLTDGGGNLLASTLIYGTGLGPQIAFGRGTQTTIVGGLSDPTGVAVDGAGDVFIADSGNNRVVEVPAGGGASITLASGLSFPSGVAVDGAGNVFIADSSNDRVVEVPAGGGSQVILYATSSTIAGVAVDGAGDLFVSYYNSGSVVKLPAGGGAPTTVASGLSDPYGVAVDGAGDVFIADSGNNRVVEIPAGGGAQLIVASGLSDPTGVAVDAAGDVFIADQSGARLVEVPAGGGPQTTIGGVFNPAGVAVDGAGNVFIADLGGGDAVEVPQLLQPPALSFATTPVGSTSSDSPQSLPISNIGNTPLSATGLVVAPNFAQVADPGTVADCTASFSLAPGLSCNVSISFTPTLSGSIQGAATVTDNALNGQPSTQSISLAGVGQLDIQTIQWAQIPTQVVGATVALSALSSSGLTVTFASQSTACKVSNMVATMVTAGQCIIAATQAGNQQYASLTVTQSFTVNSSTSFTITPEPGSETITRGVLAGFLLQLKSINGFNGNVKLSCSGGPTGAVCANLPQTIKVNGTAYAVSGILFPAKTTAGSYTMTFTGVSGSLTETATAKFTVK